MSNPAKNAGGDGKPDKVEPPLGSVSDDPVADAEFAQMLEDAVRDTLPNREELRRRALNGGVTVPEGEKFDEALARLLNQPTD